jgi:hypothetical protein
MRVGLTLIGIVFFVIGILMVLFLWPMIGYETSETFRMEDVKGGETVMYVGEITAITEYGEIFVLELDYGALVAYTGEEDFEENEMVLVTIDFGDNVTNWDENDYTVQKIPTIGGSFGLVVLIIGLVVTIAGLVTRKRTVEELMKFSVQSVPSPMTEELSASSSQLFPTSQVLPASQPVPIQPSQTTQIEQTTCPRCGRVFGVMGLSRPVKISCPDCGLEGILE